MKVAVFSTKYYEREYLDKYNKTSNHQLNYFDIPLNRDSVNLTKGFDAVSLMLTDIVDEDVVNILSENKIRLIRLVSFVS